MIVTRRDVARLLGASTVALAAGPLARPARAAEPIAIRFSHVVAPNTPKGKGADKFKELAETYTAGRVKVDVYPNSQLYKQNEELEALQLGAVQILAPSLSAFGPLGIRQFEAFDLPYIFADRVALRKVTEGPIGRELLATLKPKGLLGLAYWDNGFKIMSANTPMHVPDDFLGLKMRIQSSKVLEAQMTALGAVPQVLAFSEVYQALQTGVVDGTENPPSNMLTQKMNEVQKHATLSNHGYLGYATIVNEQFWEGLPDDIRGQLERAMAEATIFTNQIAEAENTRALAAMQATRKTTFYELTPDDRKAWLKVLLPVHDAMAGRIGKALVDRLHQAV